MSISSVSIQASKAAKGSQGFHASIPCRGEEDNADPTARCSTVQLAWLDLLQDLTGFFTKELKLLMGLCASPELIDFYNTNQQPNVWDSGVNNMRNVLTEVRCVRKVVWRWLLEAEPDMGSHPLLCFESL